MSIAKVDSPAVEMLWDAVAAAAIEATLRGAALRGSAAATFISGTITLEAWMSASSPIDSTEMAVPDGT